MEIKLNKKIKGPIIIEGFPGIGLIGTISTEFLIKHLGAEPVGSIESKKLLPIVAVHESRLAKPLELFYAKKQNLLIIHALSAVQGMEWEIAGALKELCKKVNAKEIISIEGIMSATDAPEAYFWADKASIINKFRSKEVKPLKEGIIMGVTAALLLTNKGIDASGIFVGTHSKLPDSRAAAKIIEILDKYLGLNIDYKPLLVAAEQFEKKLKELVNQTQSAMKHKKIRSKNLDYLG
ncbi:MAG: PAC2 family protein [Nanoarchaeota archaeon]|nr:PAC2 family protein [Nanoarchaeota archaeon]